MKKDYGVEVEWKAFEIRPGLPEEGMMRPGNPEEATKLNPNAVRLAEDVGLQMSKPPFISCSRPALEVAEYAKEQGRFDEFHLAVFKAYFEDNLNIGVRDILLEIAESSGLDGDEVERCLDEKRYSQTVDLQNKEARQLGIFGVPAYIIGGHIIEGAQPYDVFCSVVESLDADS